jgi:hypothetical protein
VKVYTLDPMSDTRWVEFVTRHETASVFHSLPWLEAVRRTYGYAPVVYTTTPPSLPLSNGVVLCKVRSWLTGNRMVSVPFSDHCEPLIDTPSAASEIFGELKKCVDEGNWQHVELRPIRTLFSVNGATDCPPFYLHTLDLSPSLESLFRNFHKDCVQRKIRRAERENLEYESGNSARLLDSFYGLMVQTRRKHHLPPQPVQWFRNLATCMGDSLSVRLALKDGKAVASILTLRHRNVLVYKYGASDPAHQNLGGTPLLFWKTISEAKAAGLSCLDLGRSDEDNEGLITFKDRLGAESSMITYQRWSRRQLPAIITTTAHRLAKKVFAVIPDSVLKITGRFLYRHVG